mgnify:CR=1 FL=1
MLRVTTCNDTQYNAKEYASIRLEVKSDLSMVFHIESNGKIDKVTFVRTACQSSRVNSWLENIENKYIVFRLW